MGAATMGADVFKKNPPLANLLAWWEANLGACTDAGVTLATDGQVVQQQNDQSVNGNNLVQATLADRPVFKANILNGLPVLRYDGSASWLRATFTLAQPFTVITVARKSSTTFSGTNRAVWGGVAADARFLWFITGANQVELFAGSESPRISAVQTAWAIYTAIFNGASSSLQINNGAATTGNPGTNNPGGITVGADNLASELADQDVAAMLVYNDSGAEAPGALTYLNGKYAIF